VLSRGWQEDKADFNVQSVLDRALKALANMILSLKVYQVPSKSARSATILHFSGSWVKYTNFRRREGRTDWWVGLSRAPRHEGK
jgi:hypothetical protein